MPVHWRGVIIADPGIPSPLNHGIGFQLADRAKKVADGNASKTHRSHVEINAAEFVFLGWNHLSFSSSWWKEQPLPYRRSHRNFIVGYAGITKFVTLAL